MLRRLDDGILLLTRVVVVVLLLIMLGSTLSGVFFRYVLNDALSWPEEVARYSMVWLALLGGGLVFREGGHIAVDLLVSHLPSPRLRFFVVALAQTLVAIVLLILLWQGTIMTGRGRYMTTAALRVPMYIPYAALPVGAGLMLYHLVMTGVLKLLGSDASLGKASQSSSS